MIFRNKNKKIILNNNAIEIENTKIEIVKEIKYLGINLNQHLSWNNHVEFIAKKVSKSIGAINKIKHLIPKNKLIDLYYALVYSNFKYAISIWGNLNRMNTNKLQKLQNRMLEIIEGKKIEKNSYISVAKKYQILTIKNIFKFQILIIMFLTIKNGYYENLLILQERNLTTEIRNMRKYKTQKILNDKGKDTLDYIGIEYWTLIPNEFKEINNFNMFKNKLKKWIINNQTN